MKGNYEIAVGIVFVIAMSILGYYTIIMQNDIISQRETYGISAIFPTIEGLKLKSNVMVNGVVSGVVEDINLHEHQVKVNLRMYNKFTMYENYAIVIKSESALGGKGVSIFPGLPIDEAGISYKEITYKENLKGGIEDPLSSISKILDENRNDIRMTISNLQQITAKINSGRGTLGKLLNDDSIHADTNKLVKELREAVEDSREQAPVTSFIRAALTAF